MRYSKEFIGETLGPFFWSYLVRIGSRIRFIQCISRYNSDSNRLGYRVTLAIYLTRHLSCAHLNPAVSLAMVVSKRMSARRLPTYVVAQFAGAILAEYLFIYYLALQLLLSRTLIALFGVRLNQSKQPNVW